MSDRWLSSVVSVQSTDPANSAFGTAYVAKHEDDTSFLVTCAHVVQDVGGADQVQAGRQPARVVVSGSPDGADDVAVLATDRLAAPALPLGFDAERGRPVSVIGFRPIQLASRLYAVEPVDATLGTPMELVGQQGRFAAWQLRFVDSGIDRGYSGSPIVDAATREVVAMAVYRENEQRAIAITTDVLRTIWPDGLRDLVAPPVVLRGIEFGYVPSSPVTIGTPARQAAELAELTHRESFRAEAPQHEVEVPGFYLARYPVRIRDYAEFVAATGHRVPYRSDELSRPYSWDRATGSYPDGSADLPIVLVSWHDAVAYCRWLGARLPTEPEWEKAAGGRPPRTWPWGEDWDTGRANTMEGERGRCLPVGALSPGGDSPYGLADLAGNVWEWCSTVFEPYPYQTADGREQPNALGDRVIRGGAWGNSRREARCAAREHAPPEDFGFSIGFRLALSRDAPVLDG
jgi:toxoflavin biosynthesis protein ToxD